MAQHNVFVNKHVAEHFAKLSGDPTRKVRMPLAEAKCLLINHPGFTHEFHVYETFAKAIGAGVYEVGARKVGQ